MTDQRDEDLLSQVDALLDIEPSPEATQRVLQQVEMRVLERGNPAAIQLAKDPPTSSPRVRAALLMSVGFAAAVMLIVGIVWYSVGGSPDARHELAQAPSEQPAPPQKDNAAADGTNRLFRADRFGSRFAPIQATQDWEEMSAIGVLGDMLYIVHDERLYEVSPVDGSFRAIGDAGWPNTAAIGGLGERLYIVQNEQLYEVDSKAGTRRSLSAPGEWPQTESIVTLGGKLFIVSAGLLHRVSPEDGSYEVLRKREATSIDPSQSEP